MVQQPAAGGFSLHLDIPSESGAAVLAVRGELDAGNAAELESTLLRLLESKASVVIDLSGVPFIDSAGLNAVVRALRTRQGGTVALAGALPPIARMIEIRGLNRMVAVHDSVDAAVLALATPA